MAQADFLYDVPAKAGGVQLACSVFASAEALCDELRDDALMAGLAVRECGLLPSVLEGAAKPLGDVVLVDCPRPQGAELAALARLDQRSAQSGADLVVSTSMDGLEDVFGCCDRSGAQILVSPTPAERMVALGHAMAGRPGGAAARVREFSDEDRQTLARLSRQVWEMAQRVNAPPAAPSTTRDNTQAFNFNAPATEREEGRTGKRTGSGKQAGAGDGLISRAAEPPGGGWGAAASRSAATGPGQTAREALRAAPEEPDPRIVRQIIRQRKLRGRFFEAELFADPAWEMLLDLTAARAEGKQVSVTSLCIASGVPPTTALRWISQMVDSGLFCRVEDPNDRRRVFITLTDSAADSMARYFAEVTQAAPADA